MVEKERLLPVAGVYNMEFVSLRGFSVVPEMPAAAGPVD